MQHLRLGLYTIPHTGTRFVAKFLRHHGLEFNQRHVSCEKKVPEWRHILTVRDPYKCYLTHKRRFPEKLRDANFVALWGHYIWRTQWQEAFYVPLDIDPGYRQKMLVDLIMFCNGTPDMEFIRKYAEEWPKVGHVEPKDFESIPEHLVTCLEFAYEWYRYYTDNWGAHFRHSMNVLGEGD